MNAKKRFCCILAAMVIAGSIGFQTVSAAAEEPDPTGYQQSVSDIAIFSDEYCSSEYYAKLQAVLAETEGIPVMARALAVAQSQEGYQNYSTQGIDIEEARANGLLWTGVEKRMNEDDTGNTEYTRWAQRFLTERDEQSQYLDCDWCAIFMSWCLYQAGYYSEDQLKKYYYSYYADPRIEQDADSWITAFNMDQNNVWYTPKAERKVSYYYWNHFVHTDIDPFDIPYKPGGLIFFTWDGSGSYFNHVAMVVDYDPQTHVLTYINGNSDGQVITRQMDLDAEETYRTAPYLKNSERIMAYAEYEKVEELEEKTITAEQTTFYWDVNSERGITIRTDSEAKVAVVSEDGNYFGSNIESNMLFI